MDIRRWIQIVATILSNAWLLFPFTKTIYQGKLKSICVPGLNCYSCPAAVGSCPLGALQTLFANVRASLSSGNLHLGFYVIGT
ncbi:MAG: 4Fe-4S binding protein, partial [Thermodesulfobacteriota bacterium]